SLLMWITQL
nr:Chain C, NYESO-1 peptide analogue [Homo sapiens]3KLA_F Chain F, NYESO-1 peptide analogue [Homo sapiens]